jgi:hypothetical protein
MPHFIHALSHSAAFTPRPQLIFDATLEMYAAPVLGRGNISVSISGAASRRHTLPRFLLCMAEPVISHSPKL